MVTQVLGKTRSSIFKLPFFDVGIAAGFPSPADDYIERTLDLHELLVEHPAATFFVKVEGESMIGAGMHTGDILVVDRAINAQSEKIIVALYNGAFTVKRLKIEGERIFLVAENPLYPTIEVPAESDFQVWGVVTYVIHRTS